MVLVTEPYGTAFSAVVEKLTQDTSIRLGERIKISEVQGLIRQNALTLVLCHVKDETDFPEVLNFLKKSDAAGNAEKIKVILTLGFILSEFDRAKLVMSGCSEILMEPVPEKSLLFKIEIHIRNLLQGVAEERKEAVNKARAIEAENVSQNQTRRIGPPLELDSDCWITVRGTAKKIAGRWSIQLKGPPPSAGAWIQKNRSETSELNWEWKPSDPDNDIFIREEGAWRFTGQKPEYFDNTWIFTSKTPTLTFYYDGESYGSKFSVDSKGSLIIASDSQAAVRALSAIEDIESARKKKFSQVVVDTGVEQELATRAAEPECRYIDALDLTEDYWKSTVKPRLVTGGWIIKMLGPFGNSGRWVLAHDAQEGESKWMWKPQSQKNEGPSGGTWIYRGLIPKLQGEEWFFFGKNPNLAFVKDGETLGTRFCIGQDGNLVITKDRKVAHEKVYHRETPKIALEPIREFAIPKAVKAKFIVGPRLGIESDCWLLEKRKPRWLSKGWMVKLAGPGPSSGKWCPIERDEENPEIFAMGENRWSWVPDDPEHDPFIKEEGCWMFLGRIPKFQDGEWIFFGARPELGFYYEGESYGNKIEIDVSGSAVIAADLPASEELRSNIEKSIDGTLPTSRSSKGSGSKNANGEEFNQIRATEQTHKILEPLDLESDFWLLETRKPKWVAGKWLARLKGPGPNEGTWHAVESEQSEETWQWIPKGKGGEAFLKEEGAWVYSGMQPKFQDDEWLFYGKRPQLAFFFEGESYGKRISCDDYGVLQITADSKAALDAQDQIELSARGILVNENPRDALRAPRIVSSVPEPKNEIVESSEPIAVEPEVRYVDPLELESDCWIMGPSKPRWIINRWFVRMKGPGPLAGKWQSCSGEDTLERWQWIPLAVNDQFIKEEGAWIFQGQLPIFEDNAWLFLSPATDLSFYFEGESYGSKLSTDSSGTLCISKDSERALGLIGEIERTSENILVAKTLEFGQIVMAAPSEQLPEPVFEPIFAEPSTVIPEPVAVAIEAEKYFAAQPLVPEVIMAAAATAPHNFFGPIALAFLMSELMCKSELNLKQVAQRFSSYISSACSKRKVEIWFTYQERWYCGATSDGFDSRLGGQITDLKKRASVNHVGTTLVPVHADLGDDTGGSALLGALLVESAAISDQKLDGDFVVAAGEVLRGVLIAFREKEALSPNQHAEMAA